MRTKVSSFEIVTHRTGFMVWVVRGAGLNRCNFMRARAYWDAHPCSLDRVARLLRKADSTSVTRLGENLGVEGYFSDKSKL